MMSRRGSTLAAAVIAQALSASKALQHARYEAHLEFDQLWKGGAMTREQAYEWLQHQMGLPAHLAHISQFNEEQCATVIDAARAALGKETQR
jgi:pyruvoyl-dependent arginine decarboxylase (PvlArgDC)